MIKNSPVGLLAVFAAIIILAISCKKEDENLKVTDVDGNVYNTVKIGSQVWFKENLRTTKYNDGTSIPLITDNTAWINLSTQGFCWYNNDKAMYGNEYGALYNWYSVETGQLCPDGWHVPSDNEWATLIDFLGGEGIAGGKIKSTRTSPDAHPRWDSPNTGATDEYGFSALPGGYRMRFDGLYYKVGIYVGWWSSTVDGSATAWTRSIYFDNESVFRYNDAKKEAISVRCIQN